MRYRILGSLEVLEGNRPVELGSSQQRALLAVLVLRANQLVAGDVLIEALWGANAPATAQKIVQNHVSKLRRALGDDRRPVEERALLTRSGGYELRADPEAIDAVLFERLVGEAGGALEAGDGKRAAALCAEALDLWRGPPLVDVQYESFAQAEIGRLQELHLLATEHRIEADLALGRHDAVLGELEQLVKANPLSERLRELQMLALYRAGRQAQALDAYQSARAALDELGLEPGRGLQELQAAILRHDPELGQPARRPTAQIGRTTRGWRLIGAGGAVLAGAAVVAAIIAIGGEDGAPPDLEPLSESFCSPVRYQPGETPELLVVSDQPLRGPVAPTGNQVAATIEFTLRKHEFKAGGFDIGYQACDDATGAGRVTGRRCATNAREYGTNQSVIGVIGPLTSDCTADLLPVANRAPGGPVPIVNGSNTRVGLTRSGLGANKNEPDVHYPTGLRNYVRVTPADDYQFAAQALLASRMGVRRVFVLYSEEYVATRADGVFAFREAARKLGVVVAGSSSWREDSDSYTDLAGRIAGSGADAVFLAGGVYENGGRLVRDLRDRLGTGFRILALDGFAVPDVIELTGPAAEGMQISAPGISPEAVRGPGRSFVNELRVALGEEPSQFSVYAATATELLLDAIAESDGSRESVIRELFDPKVRFGLLGDFAVTRDGDTTSNDVTIYRVEDGRLRVDRVLQPPSNLLIGE